MSNRDIVVIGGSAGSTAPLKAILGALPAGFDAAIFIVIHIPSRSLGMLATVTSAATNLPVHTAADGLRFERGNIYLAAPDHHLIIANGHIHLGKGPRENMVRPAIDALFRSAAVAGGPRVVGVLLSGLLNDGASGLHAIKRCGGVVLVQEPSDAVADEMPRSAMGAVEVDLAVPAVRIGDVLSDLVKQPAGPAVPVPADIKLEVDIAAGERIDPGLTRKLGSPTALTCPQCGGVLTAVESSTPLRFRCQVGHGFTADVLAKEQESTVDEALRVALRIIQERAELVGRMAEDGRRSGRRAIAEMYEERAAEYRNHAETIRRAVLLSLEEPSSRGEQSEDDTQARLRPLEQPGVVE
jgi:two-component system chemotaxis response regulator CheB